MTLEELKKENMELKKLLKKFEDTENKHFAYLLYYEARKMLLTGVAIVGVILSIIGSAPSYLEARKIEKKAYKFGLKDKIMIKKIID